jgi:hypothetical protein
MHLHHLGGFLCLLAHRFQQLTQLRLGGLQVSKLSPQIGILLGHILGRDAFTFDAHREAPDRRQSRVQLYRRHTESGCRTNLFPLLPLTCLRDVAAARVHQHRNLAEDIRRVTNDQRERRVANDHARDRLCLDLRGGVRGRSRKRRRVGPRLSAPSARSVL